jgi:hypothetical protein
MSAEDKNGDKIDSREKEITRYLASANNVDTVNSIVNVEWFRS